MRSLRLGRRFALPAILLLVSLLAGCGPAASSATPVSTATAPPGAPTTPPPTATSVPVASFPVSVTDDEGTNVRIPAAPQRIVSLTPATTEILFAIGAGPRVAAKVEDVANFPPEAASLPVVASFAGVDVEKIVALSADLVIAGGSGLSQGPAVEQLRRAGVPVLVAYPTSLDAALAGIRTIGRAVGEPAAADELAASMANQFDLVEARLAGAPRPRTFYEIGYGQTIYTPPADSIYGEMLRLAGANPISGDPSYAISLEALVDADPELILLGDVPSGETAAGVKARPGWSGMTAVKAGRVAPVDDIVITRPGPRLVQGLHALVAAIHPELVETIAWPSFPAASPGA